MGISALSWLLAKLLRNIRPHFSSKRNESTRQSPCGETVPASHGHLRSPFRSSIMTEHLDNFLDTKSIHINISDYAKQNLIPANCPVHRIHVGQLGANNPIEDRWNCSFIKDGECISKAIFTIIDGHSGAACSHALAWICLEYIAASLIDSENAIDVLKRLSSSDDVAETANWITEQPALFNNKGKNVTKRFIKNRLPPLEVRQFLIGRLIQYMDDVKLSPMHDKQFWEGALSRLDNDLCSMGLNDVSILTKATDEDIAINPDLLRIAQSGAVAVFGLLDWTINNGDGSVELQIANVGDCSAVLFSISDDPAVASGKKPEVRKIKRHMSSLHRSAIRKDLKGQEDDKSFLKPQRLVDPHNGSTNDDELRRLVIEHPNDKAEDLIRNGGRLLGELAPTRAFGDVRYKWPADRIHKLTEHLGKLNSDLLSAFEALPSPYISPPYLIAKPDVSKFVLKPKDRYLVLATDGLWDTLTPELAASILSRLQPGQCPATRLMRAALSVPISPEGTLDPKAKEDPRLASALLSLPPGVARLYRDDITLIVVEFNATAPINNNPSPHSVPSTSQNNTAQDCRRPSSS